VLATLTATPGDLKLLNGFLFQQGVLRHDNLVSFIILLAGLSLAFIFPGALLMGMNLSGGGQIYTVSWGRTGSGVGVSYFADTIGAIGGSLAAGFFLIPRLGTLHSLTLVALTNLFIGVVAFSCVGRSASKTRFSVIRFAALGVGLAIVEIAAGRSISPNTFSGIFVPPDARLVYINETLAAL